MPSFQVIVQFFVQNWFWLALLALVVVVWRHQQIQATLATIGRVSLTVVRWALIAIAAVAGLAIIKFVLAIPVASEVVSKAWSAVPVVPTLSAVQQIQQLLH